MASSARSAARAFGGPSKASAPAAGTEALRRRRRSFVVAAGPSAAPSRAASRTRAETGLRPRGKPPEAVPSRAAGRAFPGRPWTRLRRGACSSDTLLPHVRSPGPAARRCLRAGGVAAPPRPRLACALARRPQRAWGRGARRAGGRADGRLASARRPAAGRSADGPAPGGLRLPGAGRRPPGGALARALRRPALVAAASPGRGGGGASTGGRAPAGLGEHRTRGGPGAAGRASGRRRVARRPLRTAGRRGHRAPGGAPRAGAGGGLRRRLGRLPRGLVRLRGRHPRPTPLALRRLSLRRSAGRAPAQGGRARRLAHALGDGVVIPSAASAGLDPRALLAGRRLLVTGASGFLGKVWLCHLLCETEPAEVNLVLRPGRRGALSRLEELLSASPAFRPLHERYGEDLGRALGGVLRPLAGDLGAPGLGLAPGERERLRGVDLVVNLAGLTSLDPELAPALAANTDGALAALELAREVGAALLHVSTAYVAGKRRGVVPEAVHAGAPGGDPFDAVREREDLRALAARAAREARDGRAEALLAKRVAEQLRRHGRGAVHRERFLARERAAWEAERSVALGRERARAWGWPNAYTLTKALAENLLAARRGEVPLCVFRPTIVESALRFPFPGWKEGLQTSAPLTWALTYGPLRALPARPRAVLDVVPVDFVARGLTLAAAALLAGEAPLVLHCGSSARNPLPMRRVVELTNLAHRAAHPPRGWRRLLPEAVPTSPARYRLASLPLLRRLAREAGELCALGGEELPQGRFGLRERSASLARRLERAEQRLRGLEEAVERFLPFVYDHQQTFATGGLRGLEARLAPADREAFAADPATLDWHAYWTEVHIPGLRRWVYPRLEGRRSAPEPRRPVRLTCPAEARP
ncbi:MAG: hypothetical protein D6731_13120 [Planctomycetota bacterium]|nr:MAG: hypothetical protein D6731_13120 [Planctomycetota bacterium]